MDDQMFKMFPMTMRFGTRKNFEGGYFAREEELVTNYFKNGGDVLICGSGNGREARPIVDKANRIVCFDYGIGYLLAGKKLCDSENIKNVYFILADALNLPFPSESMDFIFYSIFCILPKENRVNVLKDLHRILKKDGYLLVTCYMPWAARAIQYGYATCKDLIELEEEVKQADFAIVDGGQDYIHDRYIFAILSPE